MSNIVCFPRASRRDERDPDIALCWEMFCRVQGQADALVESISEQMKGLGERQFSILYETIHDEFHETDQPTPAVALLMQLAQEENRARLRPDAGGAV